MVTPSELALFGFFRAGEQDSAHGKDSSRLAASVWQSHNTPLLFHSEWFQRTLRSVRMVGSVGHGQTGKIPLV